METTLRHYILGLAGLALLRSCFDGPEDDADYFVDFITKMAASENRIYANRRAVSFIDDEDWEPDESSTRGNSNDLILRESHTFAFSRLSSLPRGSTVLDLGSGPGITTSRMAGEGYRAIGLELNRQLLKSSSETSGICGSIEALPFHEGTADAVVVLNVFCQLESVESAFAEVGRVLRPGGLCLVADPHPIFSMLGQHRVLSAGRDYYKLARHYPHDVTDYLRAARSVGLDLESVYSPDRESTSSVASFATRFDRRLGAALASLPVVFGASFIKTSLMSPQTADRQSYQANVERHETTSL